MIIISELASYYLITNFTIISLTGSFLVSLSFLLNVLSFLEEPLLVTAALFSIKPPAETYNGAE